MEKENVVFKMVGTNWFIRHRCTICGGSTEKESVLCSYQDQIACRECVKAQNVDERLRLNIESFKTEIAILESLIGRVVLPSYEEWQEAEKEQEEYWAKAWAKENPDAENTDVHECFESKATFDDSILF